MLLRDQTVDPKLRDILLQLAQSCIADAEALEAVARSEQMRRDSG